MSDGGDSGERARPRWNDLGPRVVSAVVLLAVLIAAVFLGGIWFAILVGLAFAGAYREWEIMVFGRQPDAVGYVLIASLLVCGIAFVFYGYAGSVIVAVVAMALALVAPSDERLWRAGGIAYLSLVIIAVLALRGSGGLGVAVAFFLGFAVWFTDSAAFFFGRQLGGAKLSPDISPSKTWSGALGGLALGVITASITWVVVSDSPLWIGIVIAIALSVTGQVGDLSESAIKRHFRIKDSGDMIPGHGGLMDRLDSMSLAAILLFGIGVLHGGLNAVPQGALLW